MKIIIQTTLLLLAASAKNSNNSNYCYKSFSSAQAKEKGFPIKQFPADWDKYGKAAGPIRN